MAKPNLWPSPVKVTRVRGMPSQGSPTLHFTFEARGAGNSRYSFIDKDRVPDFNGDEAWAIVEKVSAKPWGYWRVVELVDPPEKTKP